MNDLHKRITEILERTRAERFAYERTPTDEEIDAEHEKLKRRVEQWEAMSERQKSYQEWLASPRWRELRNARLKLDGYVCQGCGGTATTAHHIWYPKEEHWDLTPLWTLVSLCAECHRNAHRIYAKGAVPWGTYDDAK